MTRQQANFMLVNMLHQLVEKNPDLRFGQILQAYDYVHNEAVPTYSGDDVLYWINEYYTEPQEILDRVKEALRAECND